MVYKGMQSSSSTFGSYGVYLIYLKLALLVVKEQQKRANASGVYIEISNNYYEEIYIIIIIIIIIALQYRKQEGYSGKTTW